MKKKLIALIVATIMCTGFGNIAFAHSVAIDDVGEYPESAYVYSLDLQKKADDVVLNVKSSVALLRIEKMYEHSTEVYDQRKGRVKNMQLAVNEINGMILQPGDTFSFNKIVGKRTPERGYQEAIIFLNGEKIKGYGGGICQVSSTLFLAAKLAGLEIVERHEHELPVDYAEPGDDATVSRYLDMKFKNNTDHPIKIVISADYRYVVAEIFKVL